VHSTGRLRRPLLVGNASAARLRRIPAANSIGTSLRPETRPAHMHIPSADSIRSPRGAYAPRSWLHSAGSPEKTTAAVRSEPRCEKPHSRCTNARLQERRASARRGFPNRICKCNAMNFGVRVSRPECTPRGAYVPRSWSGMRALGELCVLQQQVRPEHRCVRERAQHTCVFICRLDTFTTAGARHPPLVASADAVANVRFWPTKKMLFHGGLTPPAPGCTVLGWRTKRGTLRKNGGNRRVSNPGLADWGMEPPTASRIARLLTRLWNRSLADWGLDLPTASRIVRLLPRLWNRGLADWGMDLPTASRIVRLLPRLWNRSLVDWGMEPPTADRGVRLLPRLWNRSVTDRTMDRGAVQDLFTAHRCGLLSRAACTVNPGGRAKKARMRAIANCQWHSGSRQPRCHSERRFHTAPGIWKE
jgi:hypothetical protein